MKQAIGGIEPVREILVINDNSSDDTEAVLRGYGDAICVFPASVGGAAARNIASPVASGDWIVSRMLTMSVRAGADLTTKSAHQV